MIPVVIESPFKANSGFSEATHRAYLDRCILDSTKRNESPYASHKMLTDSLDDSIPEERSTGIEAGYIWRRLAELRVFYVDYGMSHGMCLAKEIYEKEGLPFELRNIGRNV